MMTLHNKLAAFKVEKSSQVSQNTSDQRECMQFAAHLSFE